MTVLDLHDFCISFISQVFILVAWYVKLRGLLSSVLCFMFFSCMCGVPGENGQTGWWQKLPADRLSWEGPVELRDPLLLQTCWWHSCSERKHISVESGQVALVYSHQALSQHCKANQKVTLEFYLENRPLKNALTFSCGFGIIPAFRYRKSILLYLRKHKHASKINQSQFHIHS